MFPGWSFLFWRTLYFPVAIRLLGEITVAVRDSHFYYPHKSWEKVMAEDDCFLSTLWLWQTLCTFLTRNASNCASCFIQKDFINPLWWIYEWLIFHAHIHQWQFHISNTQQLWFLWHFHYFSTSTSDESWLFQDIMVLTDVVSKLSILWQTCSLI